jgi:radical SAM protein with 4Fe4S-binding SPASM domain
MQPSISTVILKPTKDCNAGCTYCSTPPDGANRWTLDDFKAIFDKLAPHLTGRAFLIWHGGEPMLLGPDFYLRAFEHARKAIPDINFSMQTNILGYDSRRWRPIFADVMRGSISTSFDPDMRNRLLRGSPETYAKVFHDRLDAVLADGFHPKVIATFDEEGIDGADVMYDKALAAGDSYFHLRLNYRFPLGRIEGAGELLSPDSYGRMLVRIWNRWISDVPPFVVTPHDEMLKKTILGDAGRCPWTHSCGGRFLSVQTDGDVHNCSDFADLGDPAWKFGNIRENSVEELLASEASRNIRRRRAVLPQECLSCRHFTECEGGCMRDSILYEHGIAGKFHYCASWMALFDRIKESIADGSADAAISMFGKEPDAVRKALGMEALRCDR